MNYNETSELSSSAWREKVYIETSEHIICGYIFMPKIGKKNRLLTEILNGNKSFLAVKNCSLEYKLNPSRCIEEHDFIEVNVSSILILRPLNEE
ncbi:hypothetical protein IKB17_01895 [bacterium]|nr:hypothetical protein [bacterium]